MSKDRSELIEFVEYLSDRFATEDVYLFAIMQRQQASHPAKQTYIVRPRRLTAEEIAARRVSHSRTER